MPAKNSKSFEESLWDTATKLRGSVESSDWSGATEPEWSGDSRRQTARQGCPEDERGGAHQHGVAGFDFVYLRLAPVVLANGSASMGSTSTKGEGERIIKSYRTAGRADPAELQKTTAIAA